MMNLKEYRERLRKESDKSCWGCLLIYRNELLSLLHNGMVMLDVGCHRQHLKAVVEPLGVAYIGVDIENFNTKIHAICEAGYLPFKDNMFDIVTYIETLEHLHQPITSILEAHRVLKPKGKV